MARWRPQHITGHAIERYQQRVENLPGEAVRKRLSTPGIMLAIRFGASSCKLGTGHRLVIEDRRIVTVKPKKLAKRCKIGKGDE